LKRILQAGFFAAALFAMEDQGLAKEQRTSHVANGGAERCNIWIEERAKDVSIYEFGLEHWVLGALLGMKIGGDKTAKSIVEEPNWLDKVTNDDALSRIDNYCRIHRNNMLIQAVLVTAAGLEREYACAIIRGIAAKTGKNASNIEPRCR